MEHSQAQDFVRIDENELQIFLRALLESKSKLVHDALANRSSREIPLSSASFIIEKVELFGRNGGGDEAQAVVEQFHEITGDKYIRSVAATGVD